MGLRVQKVDSAGTTNYLCDGTEPGAAVLIDSGATHTSGLSERRSETSKFLHGDALGSTRGITNSSQTATDGMLYDAFGGVLSRTGTTPSPFGFAGSWQYQTDPDSGLQLLGNRYYDASTGRFISSDPAHSGRNWYAYAANNPTGRVDPQGLWIETALDLAMTVGDIGDFINDPSIGGGFAIGGDVVGIILPFTPALGRPIKYIGDVIGDLGRRIGGGIADAWGDLVGFFRPRPKPPTPPVEVWRVWGDKAGPGGGSWTDRNPFESPGYRNDAGLPDVNSGEWISHGDLIDPSGVKRRNAIPADGNSGGWPELVIPNPGDQVVLRSVSKLDTPF